MVELQIPHCYAREEGGMSGGFCKMQSAVCAPGYASTNLLFPLRFLEYLVPVGREEGSV